MKKCPFCAEEIQDEAVKCRFCGEFLDKSNQHNEVRQAPLYRANQPKTKWYLTTSAIVIALLLIGPLALPMVWLNPRYKTITKVVVTVLVIVLTVLLTYLIGYIYSNLMKQMEALGNL